MSPKLLALIYGHKLLDGRNLRLSAASIGLSTGWVWVWEDVTTGNWLLVATGNMGLGIASGF